MKLPITDKTFGKISILQRSGESIPIVSFFEIELKSTSILMSFGIHSDAIHAPNDYFSVWNCWKGIETIPQFFILFQSYEKKV